MLSEVHAASLRKAQGDSHLHSNYYYVQYNLQKHEICKMIEQVNLPQTLNQQKCDTENLVTRNNFQPSVLAA
jgi:xanthine dehydrogenase iron-sulfur cluster and FAD-binding subunit A